MFKAYDRSWRETAAGKTADRLNRRVLQENEVVLVGDTKPMALDIRIMAATNRDLLAEAGGNKTKAAQLLGLGSYQTLKNWMKRYELE